MTVFVKFNLVVVGLLSLTVVLMATSRGYSFPPLETILAAFLPFALLAPIALVYTFIQKNPVIAIPCWNIIVYSLFIPVAILFGQLVIRSSSPLIDIYLIAFDRTLGFDWPTSIRFFVSLPQWVSDFSTWLYKSTHLLTILVAVFLILTRKNKQLEEFTTYFILTAIIANIIGSFFPAITAIDFYKPAGSIYERLSPVVGLDYNADFTSLRDGTITQLKLIGINGMVAFPSFHTILALLLTYVMRGNGVFSIVVLIWSLGIIATTPFDGAHYIADIIGGTVVLMATIAIMERAEPFITRLFSPEEKQDDLSPQPA